VEGPFTCFKNHVNQTNHSQLTAKQGDEVWLGELVDQAIPLSDSCSHRKRKPYGLCNERCRQPEQILLSP
jgi:hypothetical protein